MDLIKKDTPQQQQLFNAEVVALLLHLIQNMAWDRPKDVLKADGISIALKFLPSPSQMLKNLL